jgi:hypothetical protein
MHPQLGRARADSPIDAKPSSQPTMPDESRKRQRPDMVSRRVRSRPRCAQAQLGIGHLTPGERQVANAIGASRPLRTGAEVCIEPKELILPMVGAQGVKVRPLADMISENLAENRSEAGEPASSPR